MSIDTELEQVMREEQNWDVYGIPEIDARLPYNAECDCTPDNCIHLDTRKDKAKNEEVIMYRCMICDKDTTIVRPLYKAGLV